MNFSNYAWLQKYILIHRGPEHTLLSMLLSHPGRSIENCWGVGICNHKLIIEHHAKQSLFSLRGARSILCSDIITPMRDELLDYRSAGSSKSKKSIGQRSEMPDIRQLKNFTQSSRKIWEEVILALYCQNYPLGQEYVSNVNTNFPTKDMLLTSSSKPANQHRHVRLTLGYLT